MITSIDIISQIWHFYILQQYTAYNRLINLPTVDQNKVYFTGSTAIDRIKDFLIKPIHINNFIKELKGNDYVLMTFHPVTNK